MSVELLQKLTAKAVHPRTPEPEAKSSWDHAFRVMRKLPESERIAMQKGPSFMTPPQYLRWLFSDPDGRKALDAFLVSNNVNPMIRTAVLTVSSFFK